MIKVTVTFHSGEVDTWSTTLDYALHVSGQFLTDADIKSVTLEHHV